MPSLAENLLGLGIFILLFSLGCILVWVKHRFLGGSAKGEDAGMDSLGKSSIPHDFGRGLDRRGDGDESVDHRLD
ncbi:MAG: hypothetical protein MI747_24450 [Desulfobacterales bacterium]|nr:hypothetical protein [Desulfobacterales bacterium]